jgi:8-oxo-dGTP pyrophosphatase MutT (NUDIX family)
MTSPIAGLDMSATSAAVPTPAATVLVLRSTPASAASAASAGAPSPAGAEIEGIEVFCVRRHTNIAFLGGAVVFPGGKLDPADREVVGPFVREVDPRALAMVDAEPAEATWLAVAACREALEETAILPAVDGGGAHLDAAATRAMRTALEGGARLGALLEERGARLDLGALVPFARWVTPEAERRRFDARFYLLALPPGQIGEHDDKETTQGFWDTPRGVLARFERGEVQLAPPTTRSLELLAEARSMADAVAIAGRQSLLPVCPLFIAGDPPVLALPGDPAHTVREARLDGPSRFVLRDGRFVSEDAPG